MGCRSMKIQVTRNVFTPKFVVGRISVNGQFKGFTSEGVNGLPAGEYQATVDDYGLLIGGADNIRICQEGTPKCIRVGRTVNLQTGVLTNAESAYNELIDKVKRESGPNEPIVVEIKEIK